MRGSTIVLLRIALLAAVLAACEVLPRAGIVNPMLLPPLSEVMATLGDILARSNVRQAIGVTSAEVVAAFLIAVPLGAVLGVASAENAYFGEIFRPILFYVFSIPKSIFLPMFILAFGIGFPEKVAYATFSTIFIVIMSAGAAVELGDARLTWADTDCLDNRLDLDVNKTDRPRSWDMRPDVPRALKVWRQRFQYESRASDARVLVDDEDVGLERRSPGRPAARRFRARGASREAVPGIQNRLRMRAHDLRATFVTVSLASGRTWEWCQQRTGHGDAMKRSTDATARPGRRSARRPRAPACGHPGACGSRRRDCPTDCPTYRLSALHPRIPTSH